VPYNQNRDHRGGDEPGRVAFAVTPTDATDLASYARALYVGVSGDLVIVPIDNADGATVTLKSHPVGYCPVSVRQVYATGTTATNIIGFD
jgi:hypothetical protein